MRTFLKSFYKVFPFKKQLFSFTKLFWHPPEFIYRHLYFTGVFSVKINQSKSFKLKSYGYQIENEIFWEGISGGWEKESIKHWIKLCGHSDVILDIGANSGIYALVAKTVNPSAKVYAFEPVKRVYAKLNENISLNHFDIIAIEKAVSNNDGQATIYDNLNEHIYSVTVNKNLFLPTTKVIETPVETIKLDTFVKEYRLKKIDLIKIDVETHEAEVLEGFSEYLNKFRPTLLLEILEEDVAKRISDLIKNLGYLYFNIDEKGFTKQTNTLGKSDCFNYLLCDEKTAIKIGLL